MSLPSSLRTDVPTLLDAEPGQFSFWGWQNVTIVVWHAPPGRDAVVRLQRVGEQRVALCPEGLSDVHLVVGRIGFPDSATRDALVRASKQAVAHLAAVAVVIGGTGFWASSMRSLVTGVRVLLPGRFEMGLFAEINEVVAWLPAVHEKRTGCRLDPTALELVLNLAVHDVGANVVAAPARP